jgi:hypothetical protein
MNESELKQGFYKYGNKGAVWSDEVHIAASGDAARDENGYHVGTLCGTPMLATNWARIWEHKNIGCPKCLAEYNKLTSKSK